MIRINLHTSPSTDVHSLLASRIHIWDVDEKSKEVNLKDKEFFEQHFLMVEDQLEKLNSLIEEQDPDGNGEEEVNQSYHYTEDTATEPTKGSK